MTSVEINAYSEWLPSWHWFLTWVVEDLLFLEVLPCSILTVFLLLVDTTWWPPNLLHLQTIIFVLHLGEQTHRLLPSLLNYLTGKYRYHYSQSKVGLEIWALTSFLDHLYFSYQYVLVQLIWPRLVLMLAFVVIISGFKPVFQPTFYDLSHLALPSSVTPMLVPPPFNLQIWN